MKKAMVLALEHISVCVCTYKRPALLDKLLFELLAQDCNGAFIYSIIVIDNDATKTAETIVNKYKNNGKVDIDYFIESVQNISLARNKGIKNSRGNLIAFIDDDEYPVRNWLFSLFKAYKEFNCSGVIGPVCPIFDEESPSWAYKCNFFKTTCFSLRTGTVLKWSQLATGNVLMKKEIFDSANDYFDPSFGNTGGEDTDFFRRICLKKDISFIWSQEAVAYTRISEGYFNFSWIILRGLRLGGVYYKSWIRTRPFLYKIMLIMKVFPILVLQVFLFPIFFILRRNFYLTYLLRLFYEVGKILGVFGYIYREYDKIN